MAEVEREAELLAQAGPSADRPEPARPRRSRGWSWLAGWRLAPVAAALLIAGVLAGTALDGTDTRSINADVDAPGASAQLEVSGEKATLVAQNLPPPPEGRVYEVWVQPKGPKDRRRADERAVRAARRRLGRGGDPGLGVGHAAGARHGRAAGGIGHADRRACSCSREACPKGPA